MPDSSFSEQPSIPCWRSVEQIRSQQRMRRETVVAAMLSRELRYEQRGRIRYARASDVKAREECRLANRWPTSPVEIHPALLEFR